MPVVFEHACKLGCKGIVSKRRGSLYARGRSSNWLKVKQRSARLLKHLHCQMATSRAIGDKGLFRQVSKRFVPRPVPNCLFERSTDCGGVKAAAALGVKVVDHAQAVQRATVKRWAAASIARNSIRFVGIALLIRSIPPQ
jgi:hypothetical protein